MFDYLAHGERLFKLLAPQMSMRTRKGNVKALERLKPENDDQKVGINIVRKALQSPARQIATNAGEDNWNDRGRILSCDCRGARTRDYDGNLPSNKLFSQDGQSIILAVCPTELDD